MPRRPRRLQWTEESCYHLMNRGHNRETIFRDDLDRHAFLSLLRRYRQRYGFRVFHYCLMSNHVHLVIGPRQVDGMATALKLTHGRYAGYWNAKHRSSGHVWQGRYYSCPLDRPHLWEALRYTELNPVRSGLVAEPESWTWSSAAIHCGTAVTNRLLSMEPWRERWDVSSWKNYLLAGETESEILSMRQSTHTGRPLGTEEFVRDMEKATERTLAPQKGGRPSKAIDERQSEFGFDP